MMYTSRVGKYGWFWRALTVCRIYGNRKIRSIFFIAVYTEKNFTNPYPYVRVKWIRVRTNFSEYTGNNIRNPYFRHPFKRLKKVETRIYGSIPYRSVYHLSVYTDDWNAEPYISHPYIRVSIFFTRLYGCLKYGIHILLTVYTDRIILDPYTSDPYIRVNNIRFRFHSCPYY